MVRLNEAKRYQIDSLLKTNITQKRIAEIVEVSASTISREIKRNRGKRGYRAKQAQLLAEARQKSKPKFSKFTSEMQMRVAELISDDYSPEQVVGYLKLKKHAYVSHTRIYQFIRENKELGGTLYKHLRVLRKGRKRTYGLNDKRGSIPNRVSIEERPKIVDRKKQVGHWEIDLVSSTHHKGFLLTAVERVTKITKIAYSATKQATAVCDKFTELLYPYRKWVRSITCDNGKEFSKHEKMAKALDTKVYFAHPYASWERGLNENTNGLIRQYFPKGEAFKDVSDAYLEFVEEKLNHRPRKILNFKTPYAMFQNQTKHIALVG